MNILDLAAIRARCDAATPGPWKPEREQLHGRGVQAIASVAWCPVACIVGKKSQSIGQRDASRNARFIAHARTDIPALLAYVHDLEQELAENDRLRDALAERALTAEERLEQREHELEQQARVWEQAMTEAQTDVRELRARIAELERM